LHISDFVSKIICFTGVGGQKGPLSCKIQWK